MATQTVKYWYKISWIIDLLDTKTHEPRVYKNHCIFSARNKTDAFKQFAKHIGNNFEPVNSIFIEELK